MRARLKPSRISFGEFGILELVRTGMVALERGQFTIDEQTKVKGEYDYGKNVL